MLTEEIRMQVEQIRNAFGFGRVSNLLSAAEQIIRICGVTDQVAITQHQRQGVLACNRNAVIEPTAP